MAVFDVLFDVFVDAKPPDAVAQLLSHFYDTGVTFVSELKDLLWQASRDDCLIATKQDPIRDAQLVSESGVDSDNWVASISGNPAVDCAFDDYAEFVVNCCGLGDVFQVQAV